MTSPPTVLVFRSELLPYSQTFIAAQLGAMRRHHPVLVGVQSTDDARLLAGLDVELIRHRPRVLRAPWRPAGPPFQAADVERLSRLNPTLVHAHFGADGFAALPVASALGVPLIVTFHGQDATRTASLQEDWRQWGYERRIPVLARRASHLIAVSDFVRDRLLARGVPERAVSVQRIGVDTGRFSPPDDPREPALVVAVGRLVEKKGFTVLADAFARVTLDHPEARLVILGDGPQRAELEACAAARTGRLELMGAVTADEVQDWLRRATVVAVPSQTATTGESEGLPTVVVEAMATGAAVVATRHAGIPEAVVEGVTGDLVPESHPAALATALSALLGDPERRIAYGRAARARCVAKFDLADRTARLEDLYAQLAAAQQRRPGS